MENQVMSSASSSVAQPEKCNDINVAVEESKEMAMENNNSGLWFTREVMSENPILGSNVVPAGNGFMLRRYTSVPYNIHTCRFCNKRFSTFLGLNGHMNAHKEEIKWEKKRKEMERRCTNFYSSFNSGLMDMNMTVVPRMAPTRFLTWNTYINGSSSGGFGLAPPDNSYPPMFPGNVPPFPPPGTTNLPSYLYPQENVLNEEDVILKLGNDNTGETDDDDNIDAADQPEEGTPKSWGADLSLSL